MKMHKSFLFVGIASLVGLFSSCDALEDVYDDPEVAVQKGQYYVDATGRWVLFVIQWGESWDDYSIS
jgi:hypothetical protein